MKIPDSKVETIGFQREFPKEILADPRITKEIGVLKCIQCGRCSAACPAASLYDDFSPRDMMRKLNFGDLDELLKSESIWRCGQCYSCHSRCPRNNSPATIILILRELAIRKGYASEKVRRIIRTVGRNVWEKGLSLSPDIITPEFLSEFGEGARAHWDRLGAVRKSMGYSEDTGRMSGLPPRALAEVRMILELTGFVNVLNEAKEENNPEPIAKKASEKNEAGGYREGGGGG